MSQPPIPTSSRNDAYLTGFLDGYREQVPATPANILGRIDAVIEARCACGCGQPITVDSPSAYYASPDCQQRWMERHVNDPGDVYNRPDAVVYPAVADDAGDGVVTETGPADPPLVGRVLLYGPGTMPAHLAYAVHCPACDTVAVPYVCRAGDGTLLHDCGRCEAALPDPAYHPAVVEHGNGSVQFILSTDEMRTSHTVHAVRGLEAVYVWEILKHRLNRFERRWLGHAGRPG